MEKKTDLLLTNRHLKDLNPIVMGMENCCAGHSFGPAVRYYTLLHYVVSGKGYFRCDGVTHTVKKGEVFRILPGELTVYTADEQEPWTYRWIGFDGELSEKFATLPPVFPISTGLAQCFSLEDNDGVAEYRIAAKLFRLYAELFDSAPQRGNYVRQVQDYVEAMYMEKLHVEDIARQMNLDRRYLSRLFKEKTGQTLQEYLISVRMSEATRCLDRGLSVAETAERCGYSDAFLFSKMFKRRFGVSPLNWKKRQ